MVSYVTFLCFTTYFDVFFLVWYKLHLTFIIFWSVSNDDRYNADICSAFGIYYNVTYVRYENE